MHEATICIILLASASLRCAFFLPLKSINRFTSSMRSLSTSAVINKSTGANPLANFDYKTEGKLPWLQTGYSTWEYKGNKVNYVDIGYENGRNKPKILLIHGFGASVYHWRYNIPELARDFQVFAIDMLGFGLSEKPIQDYTAELWRDQTLSFIEEVVCAKDSRPTAVCGNSLGGFTALYAAADEKAKKLIDGCILVNAAGRFKSSYEVPKPKTEWVASLTSALQRFVIGISFIVTKQPLRIEQVLRQVYPVNADVVDKDLVESIRFPAQDPNAAEVFYRVIKKNGNGPPVFIDDLLKTVTVPLLLLWGEKDPWIRPTAADKIQALFPAAKRISIDGGHCPHDEAAPACNKAIREFLLSRYQRK